jgi:hypothetical protein
MFHECSSQSRIDHSPGDPGRNTFCKKSSTSTLGAVILVSADHAEPVEVLEPAAYWIYVWHERDGFAPNLEAFRVEESASAQQLFDWLARERSGFRAEVFAEIPDPRNDEYSLVRLAGSSPLADG